MATTRVTRLESKARTREGLIAAARRVFLERGFHAATLEEIADDAGYTKGAVYSNFVGKDDLFLAVLEEHYTERAKAYQAIMVGEPTIEETFRATARFMLDAYAREPAWWPLLSEFSTHASQHPAPNARLRAARDRFMGAVAGAIERGAERHGVMFALPAREIARGAGALLRGMAVEWLIDPSLDRADVFEEMLAAYLRGLLVPPQERSTHDRRRQQ
jgi:AcrR family transcriptional regulator